MHLPYLSICCLSGLFVDLSGMLITLYDRERTFGGSMEVTRTPVNSDSGKPRNRPKHKKTKDKNSQ